jgi:hypothetical protein
VRGRGVRPEGQLGWFAVHRRGVPTAPAATEEPEDHPARQRDEPEAREAIEQHGSQRLAGAQAGGNKGHAESALGHPETSRRDVEALRSDPSAVDKQEIIPGNGGASGADAYDEDCRVGEPVDHAQTGHGHPVGWRKLERAQPVCPGPDDRAGILGRPAQQPGPVPQRPCRRPLEHVAQLRSARGRAQHEQGSDSEHAAGYGEAGGQPVTGRQAAASYDEGTGRCRDDAARQQRPSGERRVGSLPREAAEGKGRSQLRPGNGNRDRQGVGGKGCGQHGPEAHPGAAGREQPAQHEGECGHGRCLGHDSRWYPGPVQMTQYRK